MPFCACRRFSASSEHHRLRAVDHLIGGPPRRDGRAGSGMNSASGLATTSVCIHLVGVSCTLCRARHPCRPSTPRCLLTTQSAAADRGFRSEPSTIGACVALIHSFIALFGASCGGGRDIQLELEALGRSAPTRPARCCRRRSRPRCGLYRPAMLLERHQVGHHWQGASAGSSR